MKRTAVFHATLATVCAIALVSCSDDSPTPPASSGGSSISTSQASGFSGGVGAATITALESGGFQAGVASAEPPRRERSVAQGTAGNTYGTAACAAGGKEDLIFVRTFTPTNNDVDLTALKAVFTSCAVTTGGTVQTMSGTLAMSGHFFGASTGKTSDVRLTGTLSTSLGDCAFDGTVSPTGNFSGTACGQTITQSTPPPTTTVSLSGLWTGVVSGASGTTPFSSQINVPFQHSGLQLTATVTSIPGLKGVTQVFDLTQTAASGSTLVFSGTETIRGSGNCTLATLQGGMTVNTTTSTMTGSFFSGSNTPCPSETDNFSLSK